MNIPRTIEIKMKDSLENQVIDLVKRDYSMVAGEKVRNMFAKDIVKLVQDIYREPSMMEIGQTLWMGVAENDKPSYGKNAYNTRCQHVCPHHQSPFTSFTIDWWHVQLTSLASAGTHFAFFGI